MKSVLLMKMLGIIDCLNGDCVKELKSCSSFIWLFEDADVYDWSKENFTSKNSRHIVDLSGGW